MTTRSRRATTRPWWVVPLLVALCACGGAEEGTTGPVGDGPTGAAAGGAAGACLEGATECADVPTGTGGVESQPDGSVAVADAAATPVDGPFLLSGYWVSDGTGPGDGRLCEALAESFPPQCGGASLPVDLAGGGLGAPVQTEGGVTWSEDPVAVEGQVVDGVFVVGAP